MRYVRHRIHLGCLLGIKVVLWLIAAVLVVTGVQIVLHFPQGADLEHLLTGILLSGVLLLGVLPVLFVLLALLLAGKRLTDEPWPIRR